MSKSDHIESVKIVVVGDGAVGKTCLLISYVSNGFPQSYVPTVFDNYATTVDVDGHLFNLTLWDTAGQEEYDRLRPLSYPGTDVFFICFSVVAPTTLGNVRLKWKPEVEHQCPSARCLLLGLKTDLRNDRRTLGHLAAQHEMPVSRADAEAVAAEIGAVRYMECSSLLQDGVAAVFEEAVRIAYQLHHVPVDVSSSSSSSSASAAGGHKRKKRGGQQQKEDCTLL